MRILETVLKPSIFWSRFAIVVGAVLIAVALLACSSSEGNEEAPAASNQTAQELTNQFMTLLKKKDAAGLEAFLSDAFMIQRADGSFAVKADYLTRLPQIGEYTISNVSAKQAGSTIIVRWDLTVAEVIDGKPYSGSPAPRLSTFVWDGSTWQMASHANFNAPAPSTVPASPVSGQ